MSKGRYINTHFWQDTYVISLDPVEKLIFLYFLTSTLTNISGIYEIPLKQVAFDTGIDQDMIKKILDRFAKDKKMDYFGGYIFITNFVKNQVLNPSVKKGIIRELNMLPEHILDRVSHSVPRLSQLGLLNLTLNEGKSSNDVRRRKAIAQLGISAKQFDLYLLKVANHPKGYKDHVRVATKWLAEDLLQGKITAEAPKLQHVESPF